MKPKNIIANGTSSLSLTAFMLQTLFLKAMEMGLGKIKKRFL